MFDVQNLKKVEDENKSSYTEGTYLLTVRTCSLRCRGDQSRFCVACVEVEVEALESWQLHINIALI